MRARVYNFTVRVYNPDELNPGYETLSYNVWDLGKRDAVNTLRTRIANDGYERLDIREVEFIAFDALDHIGTTLCL